MYGDSTNHKLSFLSEQMVRFNGIYGIANSFWECDNRTQAWLPAQNKV